MQVEHRERDWQRLQSFDRVYYSRANRLRKESDASPTDPKNYFNPNECLMEATNRSLQSNHSSRPVARTRSFDRLFTNSHLTALIKGLKSVSYFRKGLRKVMKPVSLPRDRSLDRMTDPLPAGREFTTFDLGQNSEDLVPLLAKVAPESFGKSLVASRRSISPFASSAESKTRMTQSRLRGRSDIPCPKPSIHRKKYVDRSLLRAPSRLAPTNDATKEWEISLSMRLTAQRRKRVARKL